MQDYPYYYITDHLGAPRIITDDSGSVVWQAEYLPFGKVNISVAQIENNLRFPGQYYDAETGLHYNWNRYYDPETGRYIAADPIGLDGGINLYAYVGGNPVNAVDPMGLAVYFCHGKYDTYQHTALCVDDYCLGLMPDSTGGSGVWGTAVDTIKAATITTGHLASKPFVEDYCKEMKAGECCDQDTFERCVILKMVNNSFKDHLYGALIYNCTSWAKNIIKQCQKEACQ